MKFKLSKTIGILITVLLTVSVNAKTKDKLWDKAVRIATKNIIYVPGVISEKEKVYNEDGTLEESSITKYSIIEDNNKKFRIYLLSSKKDGKDNLKEKQNEIGKVNVLDNEEENPFLLTVQNKVNYSRTEKIKKIKNNVYIKYNYSQKTTDGLWKGFAWLNKKTGTPLKIITILQRKIFKEDYQITFYKLTINFKNNKNKTWYPKSMYSNMNIKAKIMPFVTFKGKIKTTYKYDKFWKIK